MHVLTSLKYSRLNSKQFMRQGSGIPERLSENSEDNDSTTKAATQKKAQDDKDTDRLVQLMDQKFSKFEDIITQIATSMGELRGQVNTMKGKLQDAQLM